MISFHNISYVLKLTIMKTRLLKYIENFTYKNWKISDKKKISDISSAQNIDCGTR